MATVVTNTGRAIVTSRLKGLGTEPLFVGWGTGSGTAVVTGTTLFTERDVDLSATSGTRTTGTSSIQTQTVTSDTYQVTATRTATGSGTVTNAGLFDSATIGAGGMFLHGEFTGIGLAAGDSIAFTFRAQFT